MGVPAAEPASHSAPAERAMSKTAKAVALGVGRQVQRFLLKSTLPAHQVSQQLFGSPASRFLTLLECFKSMPRTVLCDPARFTRQLEDHKVLADLG